jgi:hypothetical protein
MNDTQSSIDVRAMLLRRKTDECPHCLRLSRESSPEDYCARTRGAACRGYAAGFRAGRLSALPERRRET